MKTKLSKRLIALVLSVLFIIAFGAIGLAANTDDAWNNYNGVEDTTNAITTIGIAKQIVFINAEDTDVREPNITYNYSIEKVTFTEAHPAATILGRDLGDTYDITATVQEGVNAALSSQSVDVEFSDANFANATADGDGTACIKYATFTFDPTEFPGAGIYRYKITESVKNTSKTRAEVGVAQAATYSDTRYLDVYVRFDADGEKEIYGFVLFESDDFDQDFDYNNTTTDLAKKSAGFVNTSDLSQGEDPANVDVYTTQNLHIEKDVKGAIADKTNYFPLTMTFTKGTGLTDNIKVDVDLSDATIAADDITNTTVDGTEYSYIEMTNTAISGTIKDSGTIDFTGVPIGIKAGADDTNTTISLTETNNTPNTYMVQANSLADSSDANNVELLPEESVASNGTSSATDDQTFSDSKLSIYITNTLDEISPTGVVLYFAPYLLTLGVAVALIIGARRFRRVRVEEE
ncbi:MAG: hypothetical protein IKD89_00260 [Clostridia bacterium]|nr:hypothetical protein [Clostridia bacterium]